MIYDLEKEMRKNYLEVLQPSNETIEAAKLVGTGIVDATKESFDEYSATASKAQEEGKLGEFALKSAGSLAKGAVQGVGGALGDVEKLGKALFAIANTPEGKSKLSAFGKALQEDSFFTNSEDMSKHLEKLGIDSAEGMGFLEGTGEIFAPIGTAVGGVSKAASQVKKAASKVKGK